MCLLVHKIWSIFYTVHVLINAITLIQAQDIDIKCLLVKKKQNAHKNGRHIYYCEIIAFQ